MKISNDSAVPVYTIAGAEARPLPEWLVRRRKRSLKQDAAFAQRVELLQDFEFEEASQCVRVSEDGEWVMSTGTYKPQIHVHNLSQLALSFERHTNTINETFQLLSSDWTKSIHLQTDRFVELHTAGGLHYRTRIPRYGRDLVYDRHSAEALIPAVGVNAGGSGEVYRLNLEVGRFMKSYEIDVGGDDMATTGAGSLQGGINAGSVNTASIAEDSHNLLAFGTSLGTVEFWDPRSRNRAGILSAPTDAFEGRSEISALQFHRSGLELATGNSSGLVHLYDLRSPVPILKKDQGYGYAIKNIVYLNSSASTRAQTAEPKILTSDKRIIKIWDARDGKHWTSVEPAVDLNHVEWCKDTGMLLTANEGKQQHAFFIPQLGPAPKWCAFLDNIVEEMAEDPNDPNAFNKNSGGDVYDNFKFLTMEQLRQLNLDHLIGTTSLLRPYMHGYFVAQKLYEEARLISNPDLWQEQRQKSIAEKVAKERESRIRGNKKATVKVNRKLAEKIMEREEKAERRRAKRVLEKGGDDDMLDADTEPAPAVGEVEDDKPKGVLSDPRFARLFQDEDFEVDEASHEFNAINPSTNASTRLPKGLTAVEQEELDSAQESSDDGSSDDDGQERAQRPAKKAAPVDNTRISTSSYKKSGHNKRPPGPQMVVSSSARRAEPTRDRTFGSRMSKLKERRPANKSTTTVVGEREITFAPERKGKQSETQAQRHDRRKDKDRRSASNNAFRGM
ncbi:Small ribosomal subunit biogenesis [Didymosphaeria variabile]|uniref:Small ribosomal subunit biogenesis n=1 Tax=Didymosphaeria variabile TaxID=1932322 RepID=A0A9W8XFB2_9PLEO|nr:Small ribosomal subunit biogenesis [Didymosphaeria variabile]KAJ4349584.1 Small ribosomal subunit biogenesis [Didymosphaeria variabile]